MPTARRLARALGLFSLALGIVQLVAPGRFAKWIGLRPRDDREAAVRGVGAREVVAAGGLLLAPLPVLFLWMRVLGDLMDLALLGRARRARDARRDRVGLAMAALVGVAAVDLAGSLALTRSRRDDGTQRRRGKRVRQAISIARPRDDVYAFWRRLDNLPEFMHHLESVETLDDRRSHWIARGPLGTTIEWDAEIVEDRPGELIAWQSAEGSAVANAGSVRFEHAPGDRGTHVIADFTYDPPAGPLGVAIAKLTGEESEQQASGDLRRLKQILETGEVVVSEATLGERRFRQRPAQPARAGAA